MTILQENGVEIEVNRIFSDLKRIEARVKIIECESMKPKFDINWKTVISPLIDKFTEVIEATAIVSIQFTS